MAWGIWKKIKEGLKNGLKKVAQWTTDHVIKPIIAKNKPKIPLPIPKGAKSFGGRDKPPPKPLPKDERIFANK